MLMGSLDTQTQAFTFTLLFRSVGAVSATLSNILAATSIGLYASRRCQFSLRRALDNSSHQ